MVKTTCIEKRWWPKPSKAAEGTLFRKKDYRFARKKRNQPVRHKNKSNHHPTANRKESQRPEQTDQESLRVFRGMGGGRQYDRRSKRTGSSRVTKVENSNKIGGRSLPAETTKTHRQHTRAFLERERVRYHRQKKKRKNRGLRKGCGRGSRRKPNNSKTTCPSTVQIRESPSCFPPDILAAHPGDQRRSLGRAWAAGRAPPIPSRRGQPPAAASGRTRRKARGWWRRWRIGRCRPRPQPRKTADARPRSSSPQRPFRAALLLPATSLSHRSPRCWNARHGLRSDPVTC